MLPECLMNVCQRKSSMENYKLKNAPMVVRRSDTRTPSKPPLKTSTYQQSHGNRLHRIVQIWRGLIRRGAGEYEAKRISEAEQKRTQRKGRAKASPTELSSSDLSCSICNRQFRAKIGLISHHTHSWLGLDIVSNDRRTLHKAVPVLSVKVVHCTVQFPTILCYYLWVYTSNQWWSMLKVAATNSEV